MTHDDPQHWRSRFSRPSSAAPASAEEAVATVVLVQGEDAQGQPQWAYALIPAERFLAFRMAEEAGEYDLGAFGTVVCHGAGAEPPQEVRERMAAEYGCNPDFEAQMEQALAEAIEQLPENWGES